MNTVCKNSSDTMHRFYSFMVTGDNEHMDFKVHSFHTCISCGHRRVIDTFGILWCWEADKSKWLPVHDGTPE